MKKRKGTNNKRREKKKISKSYFILCSWRCFLPSNQSYILLPPTRDANISISFDYVKTDEINILSNLVTLQKRILILFKSNNLCTTKITILFSFQIFITSSPLFPQINSLFANSKNWRKNSFSWILRIFMKTLRLKKKLESLSHFPSQIKQKFSSLLSFSLKKKNPFSINYHIFTL